MLRKERKRRKEGKEDEQKHETKAIEKLLMWEV